MCQTRFSLSFKSTSQSWCHQNTADTHTHTWVCWSVTAAWASWLQTPMIKLSFRFPTNAPPLPHPPHQPPHGKQWFRTEIQTKACYETGRMNRRFPNSLGNQWKPHFDHQHGSVASTGPLRIFRPRRRGKVSEPGAPDRSGVPPPPPLLAFSALGGVRGTKGHGNQAPKIRAP